MVQDNLIISMAIWGRNSVLNFRYESGMKMLRRARIKYSGIGGEQFKGQIEAPLARIMRTGKTRRPRKQGKEGMILMQENIESSSVRIISMKVMNSRKRQFSRPLLDRSTKLN
jgi:hypothetical protein